MTEADKNRNTETVEEKKSCEPNIISDDTSGKIKTVLKYILDIFMALLVTIGKILWKLLKIIGKALRQFYQQKHSDNTGCSSPSGIRSKEQEENNITESAENKNTETVENRKAESKDLKLSNSPWILGMIGFMLTVLDLYRNIILYFIFKIIENSSSNLSQHLEDKVNLSQYYDNLFKYSDFFEYRSHYLAVCILPSIICFSLSFLGMSKEADRAGYGLIAFSIIPFVLSFYYFAILCLAASLLFMAAGIMSIQNAKKFKV